MKKIILFTLLFIMLSPYLAIHAQPPYAKWGKIAVLETQKHYPQAQVVDYLHIGRTQNSANTSVEKFKLWLKTGNKEFGVYVDVIFETKSEKLIKINFRKTST